VSRRIFNLFVGLYPRRWRHRYADELYDLCEELINGGDATRFRIATAIIVSAAGQRAHALRARRRAIAACSMATIIALSTAMLATNGLGLVPSTVGAGHATAVPSGSQPADVFRLGTGYAQASSTVREPAGTVVQARILAPRGVHAYAAATLTGQAQVEISTVPNAADPTLSCQARGPLNECTEAFQWCPMPGATWQLRVVKRSGPAGVVRLDLYVGQKDIPHDGPD
jgi:hypothetical protein